MIGVGVVDIVAAGTAAAAVAGSAGFVFTAADVGIAAGSAFISGANRFFGAALAAAAFIFGRTFIAGLANQICIAAGVAFVGDRGTFGFYGTTFAAAAGVAGRANLSGRAGKVIKAAFTAWVIFASRSYRRAVVRMTAARTAAGSCQGNHAGSHASANQHGSACFAPLAFGTLYGIFRVILFKKCVFLFIGNFFETGWFNIGAGLFQSTVGNSILAADCHTYCRVAVLVG